MKVLRPIPVRPLLGSALLTGALVLLFVSPAAAAEPEFLESHGDWSAFADAPTKAEYCYVGSQPVKHEEGGRPRGEIYLVVSHLPKEKANHVVRVNAGYAYGPGSEPTVTVGTNTFKLFSEGGSAWARDADTDRALVRAMRAGSEMVVRGVSARGTATVDTYSLSGFTAAHNAINAACGVSW